jgi:peptidoglycan/LPS O-acetylase OafA/YrhL
MAWNRGGWVGVDLFFVLSGFLISGLLFTEYRRVGKLNILRFLIRRAFKIYPAFWIMIGFTLFILIAREEPIPPVGLAGEMLFLQNYVGRLWNHTWSLAIEEHFYLMLALLFAVHLKPESRNDFHFIPRTFAVLGSCCLVARISNLWLFPTYSHQIYLFVSHIRVDSLFFGVLLSYYTHHHNLDIKIRDIPSPFLVACGIALLSPAFFFALEEYKWISVFGVMLFYIGSGLLVLAAVRLDRSRFGVLRFMGTLGATSYSIYLWHMPVNTWGTEFISKISGSESYAQYLLIYLIGAPAWGYIMSKSIEWPIIGLRDRLFPSRSESRRSEHGATAASPSLAVPPVVEYPRAPGTSAE